MHVLSGCTNYIYVLVIVIVVSPCVKYKIRG